MIVVWDTLQVIFLGVVTDIGVDVPSITLMLPDAARHSGTFLFAYKIETISMLNAHLRDTRQTYLSQSINKGFSLRVESIGVDDPKAFNIRRHITRIVCGFLPAGRRIQGRHILYDFCEGVKAVWQTGFKP